MRQETHAAAGDDTVMVPVLRRTRGAHVDVRTDRHCGFQRLPLHCSSLVLPEGANRVNGADVVASGHDLRRRNLLGLTSKADGNGVAPDAIAGDVSGDVEGDLRGNKGS